MERFPYSDSKVNKNALVAYALGVVAAYLIQIQFRFGGGAILSTLIITGVGGLWYHYRKIV